MKFGEISAEEFKEMCIAQPVKINYEREAGKETPKIYEIHGSVANQMYAIIDILLNLAEGSDQIGIFGAREFVNSVCEIEKSALDESGS